MVVKYNELNYAVLSTRRYKKTEREDSALLGYYCTLQQAIEEVIRCRSDDEILKQVGELGPFKALDTFIEAYTKSMISSTHQVISQVQQHKLELVESDS